MKSKYERYLSCECCKTLMESEYASIINNIMDEDENIISDKMKHEFFEYLLGYDSTMYSIEEYIDKELDKPVDIDDISSKFYLFKGLNVPNLKNTELGRVASKGGFRYNLNTSLLTEYAKDPLAIAPISSSADEKLLDSLTINCDDFKVSRNIFYDFVKTTNIAHYKIQSRLMWAFESFDQDNALDGPFDLKDLPCILGLPGPTRTKENYKATKRVVFAFRLTDADIVKKPTCFDAGLMPVWQLGGKTKVHDDCSHTYGKDGFEEYVHLPITFGQITSNIISL